MIINRLNQKKRQILQTGIVCALMILPSSAFGVAMDVNSFGVKIGVLDVDPYTGGKNAAQAILDIDANFDKTGIAVGAQAKLEAAFPVGMTYMQTVLFSFDSGNQQQIFRDGNSNNLVGTFSDPPQTGYTLRSGAKFFAADVTPWYSTIEPSGVAGDIPPDWIGTDQITDSPQISFAVDNGIDGLANLLAGKDGMLSFETALVGVRVKPSDDAGTPAVDERMTGQYGVSVLKSFTWGLNFTFATDGVAGVTIADYNVTKKALAFGSDASTAFKGAFDQLGDNSGIEWDVQFIKNWGVNQDGNWSEAAKWETGVKPQAGDTVTINRPDPIRTITVNENTANLEGLTNDEKLLVTGGNLTITGNTGLINDSNGEIEVGAGRELKTTGFNNNGSMKVNGAAAKLTVTAAGTVQNSGTISIEAGGSLASNAGLNNLGGKTLSITGDGSTAVFGGASTNAGTITVGAKTLPAGPAPKLTFNAQYTNTGVTTLSGTMVVNNANFINSGVVTTNAGSDLSINTGDLTNNTGAKFTANGPVNVTGTLTNEGTFVVKGVTKVNKAVNKKKLQLDPTMFEITGIGEKFVNESTGAVEGTGTIIGDVLNAGLINPGELMDDGGGQLIDVGPGTITVTSNYEQTSLGTLSIAFGPSGFDLLSISGFATLAGTLSISILDGFDPTLDEEFHFLTAAGFLDATGGIISDPFFDTGNSFDVSIPGTNKSLKGGFHNGHYFAQTAVPVPAAVWLFGSGLLGLIGLARKRKET